MLDCEVHSEEDDMDSYSLDIAHILENEVHDNSDLSESDKAIDITMLDLLVAQLVSEANEYGIAFTDNIYRNDTVESKKSHKSFHARYTSHPIPLGLWKDINEFPQMRIISGKSPWEMEVSASWDLISEPGKVTDEERIWNLKNPIQNDTEHAHLRENVTESQSTHNPDDVRTNSTAVHRTGESKKSFLGGSLSSLIPTSPTHKLWVTASNISSLSKEQKSVTPSCDRSVNNCGNIQIEDNLQEDLQTEKIYRSELCSTEENKEGGMWSTQPNAMTGSSIGCIKRDADKKKKKKLTKSILMKFDLTNVTQIDVFPPEEFKRTPRDEYARRIADISEKLEHYIPEKAWCTPTSKQFAHRSRQGELSIPKSVSSFASSLSTADIFDSILVNKISTKHSYLKPSNNRALCRKEKSNHSLPPYARQSSYPFVSTEARFSGLANSDSGGPRYLNPFEAEETKRYIKFEKPTEAKSWFSSVFRNIGLSKFL